jgi:putative Flp pilus-assembly TadE/G-like protein
MQFSRLKSENGAILLQVAVGLVALIAFATFVFDYGVMWVGRRQAQNAADAGALSGAVALAFDPGATDNAGLKARQSAIALASANAVWGENPDEVANTANATYPVGCPDGTPTCLRVDVFRNVARGNPLPMFFGQMVGLSEQGVRATATAQAAIADASDCLKPWAIPDKWIDNHDENPPLDAIWTLDDEFEKVVKSGKNKGNPLPDPDVYSRPGFKLTDIGLQVTLKFGNGSDAIVPGNFLPIALPTWDGESSGGKDYEHNIAECNGVPIGIDTEVTTEPGAKVGPTAHGMEDLIAKDPSATWNPSTKSVENSCAQAATPCASVSPRIVAVPIYDTGYFFDGQQTGRTQVRIVNILGFFLDQMQGNNVVGYFTTVPGLKIGGAGNVAPDAAFMKVVQLVR